MLRQAPHHQQPAKRKYGHDLGQVAGAQAQTEGTDERNRADSQRSR
jgi:hypothetical protein